ncbi:uncharacterized protein LOC134179091 [Corticium candelabrum]|uniref:uncharacterized protein LOC134179091 n=1 Tax=Corticium candelabrum TaxID=121492 RepID=UPI002E25FC17|nr:uncharacterized protein LOC134179091 [Corticium candelabrum]
MERLRKRSDFANSVAKLTDRYLLVQAQRQSLKPSEFVQVMQSTDWCSRQSFDAPFEVLSEMLDVIQINEGDIVEMVVKVDFTKLSQDMLEKAAANSKVPRDVIMMAAVKVCSIVRSQIDMLRSHITSQVLSKERGERKSLNGESGRLKEEKKELESQNQTEREDNKMEWFETIIGIWTSRSSGKLFSLQQKPEYFTQNLEITALPTCRMFESPRGRFSLCIQRSIECMAFSSPPVLPIDAVFPSFSVYETTLEKVYCVSLSSALSHCPFIVVNATRDELWTPGLIDNKIDLQIFDLWKRS